MLLWQLNLGASAPSTLTVLVGQCAISVSPIARKRDVGDRVLCTITFVDQDGALFSPDVVTVRVKDPNDALVQSTPTVLTADSVGTYSYAISFTASAKWKVYVSGTVAGVAFAADEISFQVAPSDFYS